MTAWLFQERSGTNGQSNLETEAVEATGTGVREKGESVCLSRVGGAISQIR